MKMKRAFLKLSGQALRKKTGLDEDRGSEGARQAKLSADAGIQVLESSLAGVISEEAKTVRLLTDQGRPDWHAGHRCEPHLRFWRFSERRHDDTDKAHD